MKTKKLITAMAMFGFATITMGQVPSYVPTNGLVGYWSFNGNANDESGNGNNGIVNGATLTMDRFGTLNNAYSFNGVDNYIEITDSPSLNPLSITLSGWVNSFEDATDVQSNAKAIITKWYQAINCGNASDNYNLQLTFLDNTSVLVGATTPNNQAISSISSINNIIGLNTWHHFAFVHDNLNGQKLFVDGIQINSNDVAGDLCNSTNNLLFGADNFSGTNFWRFLKGKLDDLGMWNRALSPQEINALYNSTPLNLNQFSQTNLFSVYPNPSKNLANLKTEAKLIGATYTIHDSTGRFIVSGKINAADTVIEVENLTSGIYLLSIGNLNQTFKVIKQ